MMKRTLSSLLIIILLLAGVIPTATIPLYSVPFAFNAENLDSDVRTIRVALYDCGYNNRLFYDIFNYTWNLENRSYSFEVTVVMRDDVLGEGNISLTPENFDLLLIGASASAYLLDGINPEWKKNVQQFVADGGGYVGICGGANAGSLGFEHPTTIFQKRVNRGVLGLANVYIHDYLPGEWQYLLKFGFDAFSWGNDNGTRPYYISVNTSVEKHDECAIFSPYNMMYRLITYAGGAGMYDADSTDPMHGPLIPLLIYNEEPMYTKPLHYWAPTMNGWKIVGNVTTHLYQNYAGIATTYGESGRVVLYGPHPEYRVVANGSVKEYLGHGIPNFIGPVKRYVFNYFGELLPHDYNWWIVRRSAAWVAHIPDEDLPPME